MRPFEHFTKHPPLAVIVNHALMSPDGYDADHPGIVAAAAAVFAVATHFHFVRNHDGNVYLEMYVYNDQFGDRALQVSLQVVPQAAEQFITIIKERLGGLGHTTFEGQVSVSEVIIQEINGAPGREDLPRTNLSVVLMHQPWELWIDASSFNFTNDDVNLDREIQGTL